MKYYLQLMANKSEKGLKRTIEVEAEDIPRIGDHVRVREVNLRDVCVRNRVEFCEALVYGCYRGIRNIQRRDKGYVQDIPVIRALIKR